MPIEFPTKIELVINLKTARTLEQRWRHVEAERLGVSDVGLTVHIPQARRDYCDGDSTLLIRGVLGTQRMRKNCGHGGTFESWRSM
jgi:hypothetical protein